MNTFRQLVTEAIDETSVIANKILKKMNWLEAQNIINANEINYTYIGQIASYHSAKFDDFDDETQKAIIDKIWKRLKRGVKPAQESEGTPALTQDELKSKILSYLQDNGSVMYPMVKAAEDMAKTILGTEDTE